MDYFENWEPVRGFEGLYEVSDRGRIKSLARTCRSRWGTAKPVGERILALSAQNNGYIGVSLNLNGRAIRKIVHRLVAEAFIPNPKGLPQVNHKNGDKADNAASNLEWMTSRENCRHALDSGLYEPVRGERAHSAKLTEEDVLEIRRLAGAGHWHKTIAARFGVGRKAITKIVNRQRWKHVG